MKLSICMMVKNEEQNLERCFASLKPLMQTLGSELIVVDTGSDDRSVEVARKYTDKVFLHQWNNDFAAMRNKTIEYSRGEWVLVLDADEEIEDCKDLISFLTSGLSDKYNTASILMKNYCDNLKDYSIMALPRLYRNDGFFKYQGKIHEQPVAKGPLYALNCVVRHYGYLATDKELMEKKFERNSKLLMAALADKPEEPSVEIYYTFQLGQTYNMHGDSSEADGHFIRAYTLLKDYKLKPKGFLFIYAQVVRAFVNQKNLTAAEKVCLEGIKEEKNYIDLYFFLAKIEAALKKYDAAIEYYSKYLELVQGYSSSYLKLGGVSEVFTLGKSCEAHIDLACIYLELERYGDVAECLDKVSLQDNPNRVLDVYFNLFLRTKQFSKLRTIYEEQVLELGQETVDLLIGLLENYRDTLTREDYINLLKEFSSNTDRYSMLNKIRLAYERKEPEWGSLLTEELINDTDFNTKIYNDLIYFLLVLKRPLEGVFSKLSHSVVEQHLFALTKRYKQLNDYVINYLNAFENECVSFSIVRLRKMLQRCLLVSNTVSQPKYRDVFNEYVENGISYITEIYSKNVIENELIYDVNSREDVFFIYMALAQRNHNNELEYVKYLGKALKVYPELRNGIEILLSECKARFDSKQRVIQEMEQYKAKVKDTIKSLIDGGQFDQAKGIIADYLSIVPDDQEVAVFLKSIEQRNFKVS